MATKYSVINTLANWARNVCSTPQSLKTEGTTPAAGFTQVQVAYMGTQQKENKM